MSANMTPEKLEMIRERLADGWSWRQIELTHGVTYATMKRHFPGTQMSRSAGGRLGAATARTVKEMKKREWA